MGDERQHESAVGEDHSNRNGRVGDGVVAVNEAQVYERFVSAELLARRMLARICVVASTKSLQLRGVVGSDASVAATHEPSAEAGTSVFDTRAVRFYLPVTRNDGVACIDPDVEAALFELCCSVGATVSLAVGFCRASSQCLEVDVILMVEVWGLARSIATIEARKFCALLAQREVAVTEIPITVLGIGSNDG